MQLADYRAPGFEGGSMHQGIYVPKGQFPPTDVGGAIFNPLFLLGCFWCFDNRGFPSFILPLFQSES